MDIWMLSSILLWLVVIASVIFVFFLWKKIKSPDNNACHSSTMVDARQLKALEVQLNKKIDFLMQLSNSQNSLMSVLSSNLNENRKINEKKPQTHEGVNIEAEKTFKGKEILPAIERRIQVTPTFSHNDVEKKLDSLLNSAGFTQDLWQQFSRPFDACANDLVKFLGENGIPLPKIEPFPELKDKNPNFWRFMIVQAQSWQAGGKKFVIPRNYDLYDPLWHEHIFQINGNTNKPDNYIKELKRCALLNNGDISTTIDKRMVEMKGIIAVD